MTMNVIDCIGCNFIDAFDNMDFNGVVGFIISLGGVAGLAYRIFRIL